MSDRIEFDGILDEVLGEIANPEPMGGLVRGILAKLREDSVASRSLVSRVLWGYVGIVAASAVIALLMVPKTRTATTGLQGATEKTAESNWKSDEPREKTQTFKAELMVKAKVPQTSRTLLKARSIRISPIEIEPLTVEPIEVASLTAVKQGKKGETR